MPKRTSQVVQKNCTRFTLSSPFVLSYYKTELDKEFNFLLSNKTCIEKPLWIFPDFLGSRKFRKKNRNKNTGEPVLFARSASSSLALAEPANCRALDFHWRWVWPASTQSVGVLEAPFKSWSLLPLPPPVYSRLSSSSKSSPYLLSSSSSPPSTCQLFNALEYLWSQFFLYTPSLILCGRACRYALNSTRGVSS